MEWTHPKLNGVHPEPRKGHTASAINSKIYMIGGTLNHSPPETTQTTGGTGPTTSASTHVAARGTTWFPLSSIYVLDTINYAWSNPPIHPSSPIPQFRKGHSAGVYKSKIWIYAGGDGHSALDDVWLFDPKIFFWEKVNTKGRGPCRRGDHSANIVGNVMVVIGGQDGTDVLNDVHCLNLDTLIWSQVTLDADECYTRLGHTATLVGSYLFIHGGYDGDTYDVDTVLFNLGGWFLFSSSLTYACSYLTTVSLQYESRTVHGKPPKHRCFAAAVLCDGRIFYFGGHDGRMVAHDDVHVLDLAYVHRFQYHGFEN